MITVKFFSEKLGKEVSGVVMQERKYTLRLKLEDGSVIVKKKKHLI